MAKSRKDVADKKEIGGAVGGAFAGGAIGGVAGGAAAGAAAGGLGGPAGAAIGAAVGAVAGAMSGKAIASRINPTDEDAHWQANYTTRTYVPSGASYDDYGPAYRLGYERYPEFHGKSFEHIEPDLQRDWDERRGQSRLNWNEARHAARDAYLRARDSVERAVPGESAGKTARDTAGEMTGESPDAAIDELNKLLRSELSAIETYRQALDTIRNEYGQDPRFQQLAQIQGEHQQAADELRAKIVEFGGSPAMDSGAWGTWSRTVLGAAGLLGDRTSLSALAAGERSGFDDYQSAIKQDHTPDVIKHMLRSMLARNQQHLQHLEQMISMC